MPRKICMFLQLVIYGILSDVSCVVGIFGGNVRNVPLGEYSFVVSISRKGNPHDFENLHFCTGAVISEKSIVTAAHCLLKKSISNVEVVAGSVRLDRGQKYEIQSWITYHEWKHGIVEDQPTTDDIAIIILKDAGVENSHVYPIPLLPVGLDYLDNLKIKICGWGKTATGHKPISLRMASMKVMSNIDCSEEGTALRGRKFSVPPNFFCSYAEPWVLSSCGDSGAPIFDQRQQYLVGINIGVCPALGGLFVFQNRLNSHLRLQYYRDFLSRAVR